MRFLLPSYIEKPHALYRVKTETWNRGWGKMSFSEKPVNLLFGLPPLRLHPDYSPLFGYRNVIAVVMNKDYWFWKLIFMHVFNPFALRDDDGYRIFHWLIPLLLDTILPHGLFTANILPTLKLPPTGISGNETDLSFPEIRDPRANRFSSHPLRNLMLRLLVWSVLKYFAFYLSKKNLIDQIHFYWAYDSVAKFIDLKFSSRDK